MLDNFLFITFFWLVMGERLRYLIYMHIFNEVAKTGKSVEYQDFINGIFKTGLECMMLYTLLRLGNFVEDMNIDQISKSFTHYCSNECDE